MSLVRSHYLRSSSKWRIHLLHFYIYIHTYGYDPLAFTFIHYQTPTERIRTSSTRFWKHTHYALARFRRKTHKRRKRFRTEREPLESPLQRREKTRHTHAFKKVDSNVKLFGSTIEAKKWTTYPGFFAKGGLDIMTSRERDSREKTEKSSSDRRRTYTATPRNLRNASETFERELWQIGSVRDTRSVVREGEERENRERNSPRLDSRRDRDRDRNKIETATRQRQKKRRFPSHTVKETERT